NPRQPSLNRHDLATNDDRRVDLLQRHHHELNDVDLGTSEYALNPKTEITRHHTEHDEAAHDHYEGDEHQVWGDVGEQQAICHGLSANQASGKPKSNGSRWPRRGRRSAEPSSLTRAPTGRTTRRFPLTATISTAAPLSISRPSLSQ